MIKRFRVYWLTALYICLVNSVVETINTFIMYGDV